MANKPLPSPELLRQLLRYDPKTGKLYWRMRPLNMFGGDLRCYNSFNAEYAGKEAFTAIGTHGYYIGRVQGVGLLAHRVIIAITDGTWPPYVDHDNKTKTDNRRKNLVPGTARQNMRNQKLRITNTSGVCGVTRLKKDRRWRAEIYDDNGAIHLGRFKRKKDAVAARRAAERRLGYHRNHGKPTAAKVQVGDARPS